MITGTTVVVGNLDSAYLEEQGKAAQLRQDLLNLLGHDQSPTRRSLIYTLEDALASTKRELDLERELRDVPT